ncbi:hypothetical protein [Pigmentiphaga daeguensis]|uniref:Uncharacterized protein n=1 Tax=Pigmentiphaga daeguensis TaxID=414049 RepID=A0ABP3L556_9BURK
MLINGQEWRLVPAEPTLEMVIAGENWIGRHAWKAMLDAAPTPPALGDDCDDVDAILRIVGLDPERCRTEGGALNVGRVRTLWEDVVSPAAQASGQAPAASADLGGLTDAEIDAIWTRPVSATASATVIRRETAELLIRAAALKAAPVAAQAPQHVPMAAAGPEDDLYKFYGVETDAALIAAQQRHIEKLQARIGAAPSLAPQRPREG